jgi:hypothetical protein
MSSQTLNIKALSAKAPNILHLIRTTRLRGVAVALFLALQGVLAVHYLGHSLTDQLTGPEHECALCQNAVHALPAPEPTLLTLPVTWIVQQPVLPEPGVVSLITVTGFRSRAPPASFSA